MQVLWRRIEAWLKDYAPDVFDTLRLGATKDQLEDVETILGVVLPNDMKESYRIHNGQAANPVNGSIFGLIDGYELLSLESLTDVWAGWKRLLDQGAFDGIHSEPIGPVQSVWWSNLWIPITDNGYGDNYCVDLAPALDGSVGQVISVWHDQPHRSVLAKSFRQWLEEFASGLESGCYVFSENYGGIMKKADV